MTKIIDQIAKLTVLELSELVKALEDKFGVQAVAATPMSAAGGAVSEGAEAPVEEKTEFTVVLSESGANKIGVIKALREIKPELGLKEAKDITEAAPADILVDAKKEAAEEAKKKLEEAGAKVELK
ncbi:MAG: 50S ribosomal protein L7/L12 [Patescibacteria group bacterium]